MTDNNRPTWLSVGELKARNAENGYHFFERDTMHAFRSRVSERTYPGMSGRTYFVTSEKHVDYAWGISHPRRYTVRVQHYDGKVDTVVPPDPHPTGGVPGFQHFKNAKQAHKFAKRISDADLRAIRPTGYRERMFAMLAVAWDGRLGYALAATYDGSTDYVFAPGHVQRVDASPDQVRTRLVEGFRYERREIESTLKQWGDE
jgi:hypothetical protein